jgi:hypothetical protein
MMKRMCLVFSLALCGVVFAQSPTGQTQSQTIKSAIADKEDLKAEFARMVDSLGSDTTAIAEGFVATISFFKQTRQISVDSNSVKLSNSGISATEVTTSGIVRQTIVLKMGKIRNRTISTMEVNPKSVSKTSSRIQIGTYATPAVTKSER